MEKFNKEINDRCFDISRNLLSVLNASFPGEFISLDNFLKIDGKFNNSFFYTCDEDGNLKGFNLKLDCGYIDEDSDKCSDQIYIDLTRDSGVVYYDRFCFYQDETPINEFNEVGISRDDTLVSLGFSKVVSDGLADYEDCDNHFVEEVEIVDCPCTDLLELFSKPVTKNRIIKY